MKRKSLLFLLLFALMAPWAANAQTTVEIGDGTSSGYYNPIGTYYNYSITEQLYTADEIGMAGTISSVSFYWAFTTAKDFNITMYMANVDAEDLAAGISLAEADEVFTGTLSVPATAGWVTIDLDTPFAYDGTSNLLIGFNKTGGSTWFSGNTWQYTSTTTYMARYTQNDNTVYTTSTVPGSTSYNRPNIQMVITAGGGPVCEKPATMEASNVTSNSAVLTWTGGSGTYNVEYKLASETEWTSLLANTTATTYTMTGLTPGKDFQARVQSVCGEDVSGWKSVSFSTLFGLPLVEEFGASIPTGWSQYTGLLEDVMAGTAELTSTSYAWTFGTGNGVFDNHARVNIYGASCYKWLVLPSLAMENNVELIFDVALTAYSGTGAPATTGTDDKFVVLANVGRGWTILRQWDNAGSEYVYNDLNTTPITVSLNLSSYAGQNVTVAFYGESTVSNADNNLHIDNVSIDYIPACPKPTNLAVNYEGNTSATVTWEGDAAGFEIDYNGTQVTGITGNSYELTGLNLGTEYEVKVRSNCGADGVSEWTNPVSFTTNLCLDEDMCILYFVTIDSYGDGWNNAYIQVTDVETGIVLAQVANTSAAAASEQQVWGLSVCDGREIQFTWVSGNYDSECSYGVFDLNEDLLFSGSGAMSEPFNWTVSCVATDCRKPSTPEASEIGPHSVVLSWTEYGPATEWVVAYKNSEATEFTTVNTTENPFTLTGLNPESTYTVKVLPVCEVDKWSDETTFTTTVACPAPTALEANHVTATSATLNWEGWGSQYNVRYGIMAHGEVLAEQNFDDSSMGDWTNIDADGDGYEWVLATAAAGVYHNSGVDLTGQGHEESTDFVVSGSYSNAASTALTPDNYLVSPQVALGGSISFWAQAQDANYAAEHFGVAVSTTGNTDAADFTTIAEWTMTAKGGIVRGDAAMFVKDVVRTNPNATRSGESLRAGNWYKYTVDLSDYSGQGYVAIRHFNCTDQFILNVDDIVIEGPAQMQWTTLTTSDDHVNITGLTAETEYTWQVQANCGEDGTGAWSMMSTFTTGDVCETPHELEAIDVTHDAATLTWAGSQDSYNVQYRTAEAREEVYFTNFNDGATPLHEEGWNWEGYIIYGLDDPIYNIDGDLNYFLQMGWATTEETYIFSPELPEYESGAVVEFYPFYYSVENTFQIGYSTTTNDTIAFSWSEPITAGTSDYDLKYSAVLPDGVKYIAFKATAADQTQCIFIDNFGIYDNITPAGEWIPATVTESTLALTGLTPETEYEWQVQGINSDCEDLEWTDIVSFTTTELTTLTQTIELTSGVNWVSFYVETNLDDLKAALVDALGTSATITVKSRTSSVKYQRGRWAGNLTALNMAEMYKIDVPTDCEISLEGMPIDPATLSVTITPGANWIAYPYTVEMTLPEFFGSFPITNDVVKSKSQNSKYNRGRWAGSLTGLVPGQGYIYVSADTDAEGRTFTFPASAK